jgi:hypothetical protein
MFFCFVTRFVIFNSALVNDLLFCVFTFLLLCRLWANTVYFNFPFSISMLPDVVLSKSSFCVLIGKVLYCFWCMYHEFFVVYYSYRQMHNICIYIIYAYRGTYKLCICWYGGDTQWRSWLSHCCTSRKSRVWFAVVSLEFFIDIFLLVAQWPWGWISL